MLLSGETCIDDLRVVDAPASKACLKAWNGSVKTDSGDAGVSRGRSSEPSIPMTTRRTQVVGSSVMKNKEEPSIDSTRGNPSTPASRQMSRQPQSVKTTGSTVRLDDAASASIEKPALSLFPESLMEAVVDQANVTQAWQNVKANRGAPGPDGITISEFPAWVRIHWQTVRSQLLDCHVSPFTGATRDNRQT